MLVQSVLTSMLVYLLMSIDKIRRCFLWRGSKDAQGGHCLLAWLKVTRPFELGGLGTSTSIYRTCWDGLSI